LQKTVTSYTLIIKKKLTIN